MLQDKQQQLQVISSILEQESFGRSLTGDDLDYILVILESDSISETYTQLCELFGEHTSSSDEASDAASQIMVGVKLIKSAAQLQTKDFKARRHPSAHAAILSTPTSDDLAHGNTFGVVNNSLAAPADVDPESCISVQTFLEMTKDPNPVMRKRALRELCPCHVLHDVEEFWNRIFEMVNDPDVNVRLQALHNLIDGSPKSREDQVIKALDELHRDSDPRVRSRANKIMTQYFRTGKWNEQ